MGGPGGPGSGTGGGRFHHDLPSGVNPFTLATSESVCDERSQRVAKPFLNALRAYADAYARHKSLPPLAGFAVTPHRPLVGSSLKYWLEIEPVDRAALVKNGHAKAIFACSYVHDMGHGEVMSLRIDATRQMFLNYAPGLGLFSVHN